MLDLRKHQTRFSVTFLLTVGVLCLFISMSPSASAELYMENFSTATYNDTAATTAEWNTMAGEVWMPYFNRSLGTPITVASMYYCSSLLHHDSRRIYVFGSGYSYKGVLHYNTETQESVSLGNTIFSTPVNYSSAAMNPLTGMMYIFGGGSYSTCHDKIHRFNPETFEVTELAATLPQAMGSTLAVYSPGQGCIYIFGGENSYSYQSSNKILRFDLATETLIESSAVLPVALGRMGGALHTVSGKIYLFGGYGYSGSYSRRIFIFDPATDSISQLGVDLPYSMYNQKVIFDPARGQFMLFKGYYSSGGGTTIMCFDPKALTFKLHAITIAGSSDVMAVANPTTDRVFLLGSGSVVTILDLGYPPQAQVQSKKLNGCNIVSSLVVLVDYQEDANRVNMIDSFTRGEWSARSTTGNKLTNLFCFGSANGGTTWEEVTPGVSHTFSQPGGDFRWRVVMTYPGSGVGPILDALAISYEIGPDTTPPQAPIVTDQGTYTASDTRLQASWTCSEPETCITKYEYAIGTAPGSQNIVAWTEIGLAQSLSLQNLTLEDCQTYYINVRATNQDDLIGPVGSSDGIKVITSAPGFSGLTRLVPGDDCGTAEMSWNAASPLVCDPAVPIKYNIYRSLNPASGFALFSSCANPVTGLTYTATNLPPNVNHYFLVRAEATIDALTGTGGCRGNEDSNAVVKSIMLSKTIFFDGLQQAAMAQDNCGAIDLSWNAAIASCAGSTLHYNIYRSFDGVTGFTRITSCPQPLTELSYRDTGVFTGKTYHYIVRAEDDTTWGGGPCGGFGEYNTYVKKVTIPHLSPTFSGLQSVVPLDSAALLTWNPATPACDGGTIHYNIFRTLNPLAPFQCITSCDDPVMTTTFTDTDLINGETYYYMVRAEDNANLGGGDGRCHGNSDENAVIIAVTPYDGAEMVPTLNTSIVCFLVVFFSLVLYINLRRSARLRAQPKELR